MTNTAAKRQAPPPASGSFLLLSALYAGALSALLAFAAVGRGPWLDEFWTYFLSDPSVGLSEAFAGRWVFDVHPPLFSLLAYLSAQVIRLPVEEGRLLNFIPLALCAIYLATVAYSNPRERAFIAVFSISVSSASYFTEQFSDFRSYFTGICAFSALLVTLKLFDQRHTDAARHGDALLWSGFLVSLAACLNIHYLTAVETVVLVAVFGLRAAWRKCWRLFSAYLAAGIFLSLPLIAVVAWQWSSLQEISHDYWLKTGMIEAMQMMAGAIGAPVNDTLVLVLPVWLVAVLMLIRSGRNLHFGGFVQVLALVLAAEAAVLLVYTWATAAMMVRYLMPVEIIAAAILSALLAEPLTRNRWLFAAFVIASLSSVLVTMLATRTQSYWNEAARFLGDRQKACATARVVPMLNNPDDPTPNTFTVENFAAHYVAQKQGLKLSPLNVQATPPGDPACPDYYWIDHFFANGKADGELMQTFRQRYPSLAGCHVEVTTLRFKATIFTVTGQPPACNR